MLELVFCGENGVREGLLVCEGTIVASLPPVGCSGETGLEGCSGETGLEGCSGATGLEGCSGETGLEITSPGRVAVTVTGEETSDVVPTRTVEVVSGATGETGDEPGTDG